MRSLTYNCSSRLCCSWPAGLGSTLCKAFLDLRRNHLIDLQKEAVAVSAKVLKSNTNRLARVPAWQGGT